MASPSTKISRFRFIKAYSLTFSVLLRYLSLWFFGKLVSNERKKAWFENAHTKTAKRITKTIFELKGLYIKIGQTLSIMTNFLPHAFTKELEELQDAVPPHSFDEIEKAFLLELKKKPDELFSSIEKKPIASASLGQVHVGYTVDGVKLAIKVQYPNIDTIVKQDLKTIKRIFGIFAFIFPHYGLKQVYAECAYIVSQELDYTKEAQNMEVIRKNFKDEASVHIPKVFPEFSTKKVLTTEFVDGIKITSRDEVKKLGVNPTELATLLINTYCQQIFVDGHYHADPHPGNILVQQGPRIVLLDFGAVAEISSNMKDGLALFVEGLLKQNTQLIAKAMRQMGFVAKGTDENDEVFHKVVDYFYGKIKTVKITNFRDLHVTDFQNLGDLIELKKMDVSFKEITSTFHVPREWVMLERTLILLMGLVTHLDPHLNPMDIVLPYVEKWVLGKDRTAGDLALEAGKEWIQAILTLPRDIKQTLQKLNQGKISIKNKSTEEQTKKLVRLGRSFIYTLLLIPSFFMWYSNQNQDRHVFGYSTLVLAMALLINLLRNR